MKNRISSFLKNFMLNYSKVFLLLLHFTPMKVDRGIELKIYIDNKLNTENVKVDRYYKEIFGIKYVYGIYVISNTVDFSPINCICSKIGERE